MLWIISALFIFPFFETLSAQEASCLPFYNWASNSENQNPCQVASALISVCNGGPFPVLPLPPNSIYLGPTLQTENPCQCNTVTYSLMSACGACQGQNYLSWSVWSANCAMVAIDTYPEPIPPSTSIPGWAFLDIQANDNWDQTNARNNANLTESSAIPSPTSSSTSAHSTTSSISSKKVVSSTSHTSVVVSVTSTSSVVPSATNSSQSSTFSEARSNAVGGGVVGGLAGVTIIFGLLFWYVHNRKRTARNGLPLPSPAASNNPSWHGRGPYMTQVPAPPGASDQHPSSTSSVGNQTPYHHDSSAFGSADSVPAGRSQV